jgi:5-methylcytosine-specific restriction protein A
MASGIDRRSPEANAWRKLYSTAQWRALRAMHAAAHPLCEECLKRGRAVPLQAVNHKIPHKGDRTLFFDDRNLQSLCNPHHDGPTQRAEAAGFSPAVDTHGYPVDPAHPANR